jgi:predicted ATPase/class 3 adenylate cyclase
MASGEPLPSGLVTFVFTDIEGSTRLFRALGDGYAAVLARHHEILRGAWARHGGLEVKTEGDAFFVAFSDAADAVRACADGQRLLAVEQWPANTVLRVRMGLHTGLAWPTEHDYIAFAVHQAARVVDVAHGGQIVATDDTAARIRTDQNVQLLSLGRFKVRDFDEPVELFQVQGTGLPADFPPLRVLPADRHNLVPPTSSIVGRGDDFGVLSDLLRSARLVTVVGPGGLGKTRLVTEYGIGHADDWDDGIWFIDLAPVSDPIRVPHAVGEAIGVRVGELPDTSTAVREHLRQRRVLLVMDNCEHVAAGVARHVDELLGSCPRAAILATSRVPLGLRAERLWRLQPLDPATAGVELFCDRAGITTDNDPNLRRVIAELCRLLDGLPLAIELAAARTDVLAPAEILAHLGQRPGLLRSGDPTLRPRQRNLDDTIAWSHRLLNDTERVTFRRLGVFTSGFGLETATHCVADASIDPFDVPELVWSLVAKSLVVSEPAAGSTRYRMLHTVRAFARRELERSSELPHVSQRLANFYIDAYGPELEKFDTGLVAGRATEIDNVRGLVPMVVDHDADMAYTLACMVLLDHRRSSPRDGLDEGERFLGQLTTRTRTRVGLLVEVIRVAVDHGLLDRASGLLDQAELLAAEVGEPSWVDGRIAQQRGLLSSFRGDHEGARSRALTALPLARTQIGRCRILNLIAMACLEMGEMDEARQASEAALDIEVALDNVEARIIELGNLAEIELRADNPQAAAERQLESLDLALVTGSAHDMSSALILAARLASAGGDWLTAVQLQGAADLMLTQIGVQLYPTDRALCDELLSAARHELGERTFGTALQRGKDLTVVQAVDEARRILTTMATDIEARSPTTRLEP